MNKITKGLNFIEESVEKIKTTFNFVSTEIEKVNEKMKVLYIKPVIICPENDPTETKVVLKLAAFKSNDGDTIEITDDVVSAAATPLSLSAKIALKIGRAVESDERAETIIGEALIDVKVISDAFADEKEVQNG